MLPTDLGLKANDEESSTDVPKVESNHSFGFSDEDISHWSEKENLAAVGNELDELRL